MKNFLVQQLSTVSDKSSAGILGCLAGGINIKYECWDGMEVKALLPGQVQFLKSVIEKLMGSMTLKCNYDGNQKCREYGDCEPVTSVSLFVSLQVPHYYILIARKWRSSPPNQAPNLKCDLMLCQNGRNSNS